MKRKILTALIAIIMAASLTFGFTACFDGGNEPTPDDGGTSQTDPDDGQGDAGDGHTHTFADTWSFDAQNHWHAATCGHDERADIAAHVIEDGVCTVCGAVLEGTEGLEYTLSQDESYYIVSGIGTATATDIVIPSIYNDLPVTSIGDMAFYGCTPLTSVTIGNGVTSIDYAAFSSCSSLESITIPDSVTYIGFFAFAYCHSLESVYISDIAAWCGIDNMAFDNPLYYDVDLYLNGQLVTDLVIPEGVTSIGMSAFLCFTSIESVAIPDSVTYIGHLAFTNTSIESVTIPDSVTSIGYAAFGPALKYNEYDNALYLGNQDNPYLALIALKENASSCTINKSTKIVADGAFISSYPTIESISADENNEYFTVIDGILFDKDCKKLICYPAGKTSATYTIPDGVTSIGEFAFSWCKSLESVAIPDSVTYIGQQAFLYCTSLENITIPDSVTSIGYGAFSDCTSLKSITIPDSVTYIGQQAFSYCTSLENITIPDSVTYIGDYAFSNCTSLERVYYTGNEEDWEKLVEGINSGLEDIDIVYNYKG